MATRKTEEPQAAAAAAPGAPVSPWYWDGERARVFAAGRVGLGASANAELDLGYGKPFWLWAGFQGWGVTTSESAMASVGWKLGLPIFELTGGYRIVVPFQRGRLSQQERYVSDDLAHADAEPYAALDCDAIGYVPLPHFVLVPEAGFHFVGARRAALYEEEQRVIMNGPWLWYGKLSAFVTWGNARRFRLGPIVEYFASSRALSTVRLGPAFSVGFTPHLDALAYATLPVSGPDSLSFYDGMGGSLSLRYRWASDERERSFP